MMTLEAQLKPEQVRQMAGGGSSTYQNGPVNSISSHNGALPKVNQHTHFHLFVSSLTVTVLNVY